MKPDSTQTINGNNKQWHLAICWGRATKAASPVEAHTQRISVDLAFVSNASPEQNQEELESCSGQKCSVCGWDVPTSGDYNSGSVGDTPVAPRCSWYMCASTYIAMASSLQRFIRSTNCCACHLSTHLTCRDQVMRSRKEHMHTAPAVKASKAKEAAREHLQVQ